MARYPVLRSGFVGLSATGLVQPNTVPGAMAAAVLNKRHLETDDYYFYHEGIQSLFVQTVNGAQTGILNQFDFQERILKAAADAFGTKNFWDWVTFQLNEGSITVLHSAFLTETLNYISGIPRKTQVQQWIRLLEANKDSSQLVTEMDRCYASISEIKKSKMIPSLLSKVFVQWLRQYNGYYDFMCSLEVIFGNRRLIAKAA